jgi:hypothetical protein
MSDKLQFVVDKLKFVEHREAQAMRSKLIVLLSIATFALMFAPLTGAGQQRKHAGDREYTERDDINQTYELAPGARVELSVISGSVDVETTNGNTWKYI